jgi:CRP-like cAMP-binding protein
MNDSKCQINCLNCPAFSKSIFKSIDHRSTNTLVEKKIFTQYKKGETIFHQGTPSFGVYCIGKGKVKLSKVNAAGGETIFLIAPSGKLTGYQDHLHQTEYLTTATVLEDTSACFISNDILNTMITAEPSIAINLLQQTVDAMETSLSYGHASTHMSAKNRVASLVLNLGKNFGIELDGKIKIDIRLTRHEMASMVGTASETMIRSLTELKQMGILEQEGNYLMITDMNKLHHLSISSQSY